MILIVRRKKDDVVEVTRSLTQGDPSLEDGAEDGMIEKHAKEDAEGGIEGKRGETHTAEEAADRSPNSKRNAAPA